ncbi:MAG: hypothetical protein MK211_01830 [Flavobacteriales bacterium]|uniref:hypothetical protein n=1 Tax=Candidatus Ulvibacter alkanivorans TaxID=2267620 RepID=UPI000DF1DCF1|nr:hypothetical protein [Candidatus Ulvibacter alkanivorans]MCH2488864.1 hypothetical protein [Flavobacteriales bacterium]
MKKTLLTLGLALIAFITLTYFSFWSQPSDPEISVLLNNKDFDSISFANVREVKIAASTQYDGNLLKRLMQGEHYRRSWEVTVLAEIVYLDTLFGGMEFVEEGGGKQTSSLEIKSKDGVIYTLRSINKNPEALVPEYVKSLGVENLIMDGISAQHPYGALPAASLSETVNVIHTHPRLVFIPEQAWLSSLNQQYGNRLYFLEYESEGGENWTGIKNVVNIIDTEDLIELKLKNYKNTHIDYAALVRARLLDLFIGDWDRHAKQWGWAMQKKGDSLIGIPIAADRDNAFFTLDGVLPTLISNKNIKPKLRPFKDEIDYLPGLLYDFDAYFLKDVPVSVFISQAEYLQAKLTDDVIEKALLKFPKEVYDLDAEEIEIKLKSRRENLVAYAKKFKLILNEKSRPTNPLNGLYDVNLPEHLIKCFDCSQEHE